MKWLLTLAALLGAVTTTACGDSSATDHRSGSAGNDDIGVSDDRDSGHDCPSGQVEKKADGTTVCITQPNVQADGAIDDDGAGGSIDPPTDDAGSDTSEPTPDAATDQCPEYEGLPCVPMGSCTLRQFPTSEEHPCDWDCTSFGAPAGEGMWPDGASAGEIPDTCQMQ